MALTGRTVSAKEVVFRAIRDADLSAQDFNLGTMLEWCAEGLDLIGCPMAYRDTIACIDIVDHRGILPCNLVELKSASTLLSSGLQIPMRIASSTFHPIYLPPSAEISSINYQQPISYDAEGNPVFSFMNFPTTVSADTAATTSLTGNDVQYTLNDNYIFTSFKDEAKVLISYKAFPTDEEGFPLIPDNEKFKSYLTWHLLMKTYYRQYIKGKVSREVYVHAETERNWYCGAATTAGLMPSIDQMESWKNQFMHLLPRLNEHSNFFKNLGDAEYLKYGQTFNRY